jgi:two-component system, OmpR family, response regulator
MTTLERILHVDDDDSIRMVCELILQKLGKFTVKSCASGAQALAEAVAFDPQVILLDLQMPGMDGPATLQQLQQLLDMQGRMVLFMTAMTKVTQVAELQQLGAFGVIEKPFEPIALPLQIQEQWQRFREASNG